MPRADRGLKIHAKHSKSYVTNRVTYIQNVIATAASRANVPVQHVTVSSNANSSSGAATHGRAQNNRVDQLVASFNSSSSTTSTAGSALPANAIENNLLASRAGVTGGGSSGTSSSGRGAIAPSNGATNVIASSSTPGSTSTSSSTATGAGSTTTTPGNSSIGTIGAQVFSNAFTQDAGSINSTINGVNASLERLFGSLETQSGNNVATTVTSFSSAPAGTFEPTVGFVPGNGVT